MNHDTGPKDRSDQHEVPKYGAAADAYIDAARQQNPMQRLVMMREFLASVMEDTAKGEVQKSDGTVFTPEMVQGNLKALLDQLDGRVPSEEKLDNPMTLLPRANGLRGAFDKLLLTDETAQPLMHALEELKNKAERGAERLDTAMVDELGHEAVEAAQSAPVPAAEKEVTVEKNEHLRRLFTAPERPILPESSIKGYDYMFADDDIRAASLKVKQEEEIRNEPIRRKQAEYDRLINDDTREYSVEQLRTVLQRDAGLRDILGKAGFTEATPEAVNAIREDPELSYQVGTYFLDKVNRLIAADPSGFGDRLIANKEKRTDFRELPVRTSSREYAAYLAWAKVGGMFDYKRDTDQTEYDETGRPRLNQHREAANSILYSY